MTSKEALELAILEYKKDLEEDSNNQWVKNVLQGLKEVKQDLELFEKCKNENCDYQIKNAELQEENEKLKQVIDILKDKLDIKLEIYHNGGCILNHKIISNCITSNDRCLRHLEIEQYELLKEVLKEYETY